MLLNDINTVFKKKKIGGSSAVILTFSLSICCCLSQEIIIMGMTDFCMLMVSSGCNGTT